MMFLLESNNTGDITPYLPAETARIGELHEAGILEMVLLKADQSGAFLLLRAPDEAVARDAVESLPLVIKGVTTFEITEVIGVLRPALNRARMRSLS